MRDLNSNFNTKTIETHETAFSVIKTLLKTQVSAFLHIAMPLIDYIRRAGICTKEMEKYIEAVQTIEYFTPVISAKPQE